MNTLRQGLKDDPEVFFLQQLLNEQGLKKHFVTDGDFGPNTQAGVKDVQRDNDLPVTGIVDDDTWDALREDVDISKNIQITIDDAPGPHNADMRLLLRRFNIHTMFFVEGQFAAKNEQDIKAIVAEGHGLGLHTWDHPELIKLSDEHIREEILKTDALIQKQTGSSMAPNWRPPYGEINGRVRKVASAVGFTKAWLWDADSLDWKYKSHTNRIVMQALSDLSKCKKKTCDILFHDLPTSVKALNVLLPLLIEEGNTLVDFPE
jgi:peptidoglycan/xylan/chitin deacetylase (PgdA/CDA1 family)